MGKARAGEPGLWDPREVAGQGTLLCQEQGGEQAQRGLVPKAGPTKGHWILRVNQEGGKAFGSAPNQAKPGAPASRGASSPEHQPPPDTPGTSCRSGIFVFQFSFPRTTTCSMPSLGGGCSFPLPSPTLLPAGSAPARWKAKGFFPQWDAPEGSGRAARPRLLHVGQEQCPAPRALNA